MKMLVTVIILSLHLNAVNMISITDYPNYKLDVNGDVFNKKGNRLKHAITCDGYHRVALCKNNKRKYVSVQRLVAISYIKNPLNKPQVNHIDGDKSNNHVSNLEWVTRKENIQHAIKLGLFNPSAERGAVLKLQKNNTSGVTGVFYNKFRAKKNWGWSGMKDKKQTRYFCDTKEEAIECRNNYLKGVKKQ